MFFFNELNELRERISLWLFLFLLVSVLFFIFPTTDPFSIWFLERIQKDLLPENTQLIVLSPISGFLIQAASALFLGFIATIPLLIFQALGFILPALYEKEKKTLIKILIPSVILFLGGCAFSYFFLIPFTFDILYSFTLSVGALPLFEFNSFLGLVLGLIMGSGILFLLPIFMVSLSLMGAVEADFWKKQSGNAIFSFVLISAIVTPDGTGITMLILTAALTLLYFSGYLVIKTLKRSQEN